VSSPHNELPQFDFGIEEHLAGYRLQQLELYNWGTFHHQVWCLHANGHNTLVTGDIGSGKSTLVDAITTLLIPTQKIAYNKAAGAGNRERSLRSYVQGYYKSERSESSGSSKPVALRDHNSYSVILGTFHNAGYDQDITLAQVFWSKDTQGQPARFFLVAQQSLSIADHFSGFGKEINQLKRQLRKIGKLELFESFPPYAAQFRRLFGIKNDQALELFHQTVSMKSVGNLTDFVRAHMLEAFPVQPRIDALIHHFDDLNRAHESILRAKQQIERLTPLVANCNLYQEIEQQVSRWRSNREALSPFFAHHKEKLLTQRINQLQTAQQRIESRLVRLQKRHNEQFRERDQIKQAISQNGGDRLQQLTTEIEEKQQEKQQREQRAARYCELAHALELNHSQQIERNEQFIDNQSQLHQLQDRALQQDDALQNQLTENGVALHQQKEQHQSLERELNSLRQRKSNISEQQIKIRQLLCQQIGIDEEEIPFAGELIQVHPEERNWEGAAERLLHNFALSLLVPDHHYPALSAWVEKTHLRGRLVYYRIRNQHPNHPIDLHPDSLAGKLSIKPDSIFYPWLESELGRRFDYACCELLEQFHREQRAITPNGQIKSGGTRHEKDDRHAINDRSRFVLGWSNREKIETLELQSRTLERALQQLAQQHTALQQQQRKSREQLQQLARIREYGFNEIHWQPLVVEISQLQQELQALKQSSNQLETLTQQLTKLEQRLQQSEEKLDHEKQKQTLNLERQQLSKGQRQEALELLDTLQAEEQESHFPLLQQLLQEAIDEEQISGSLTIESCDHQEKTLRSWLQNRRIDPQSRKAQELLQRVISAMQGYRMDYPLETEELDDGIEAAEGYRTLLAGLQEDDLPTFEQRFKQLLNENTIHEVANFQSQLARERDTIKERIERINHSLNQIDYNRGRYIQLETQTSPDIEIRDFRQELKNCTEGTLSGSEDEQYSEAKFIQVKNIIERFRGRDGSTELDRRWTRKVTDVRNSFTFSASERWREDDREHEHYTDSGGKSGGQKEKLAYTVLAASLAYQFGLEWGETRSRSFRFVVIDEAFGRGSDESARFGLNLFKQLNLQLLIVTPLQKIHIIEPYIQSVGFVHNEEGRESKLRNLTIEEYQAEKREHTQTAQQQEL